MLFGKRERPGHCCGLDGAVAVGWHQWLECFLAADARLTQQEILKGAADPVAQVGRFTDHTIKEEAVGVGECCRC